MPSYTDPQTGKRIRSDTPLTDADLEEAFGGGGDTATTSTPTTQGPLGRAGSYLLRRGGQIGGALGRLSGFGEEMTPGSPMPEVSPGRAALDVLTVGGTGLAPGPSLVGLGVGTGSAALGASEDEAELLDVLGTVGTGIGQGVHRVMRGTPAERAGAAAVSRGAEETAGAGRASLEADIATARTAADEAQRTAGTMQARAGEQAARPGQVLGEFQTVRPEVAGRTAQGAIPPAEAASRTAMQGRTYDAIGQAMQGRAVSPEAATTLRESLESTRAHWGPILKGRERGVIRDVLQRLRPTRTDTGVLGPTGQAISREVPPAPITWQDLDQLKLTLQPIRGASVRRAIAGAQQSIVAGTPYEEALAAAGQEWRAVTAPTKALAGKVAKAESPEKAFRAVLGTGSDPSRLQRTRQLLGADSEAWETLRQGAFGSLMDRAAGDPGRLVTQWGKMPAEVRSILDPGGEAGLLIDSLSEHLLAVPITARAARLAAGQAEVAAGQVDEAVAALEHATAYANQAGRAPDARSIIEALGRTGAGNALYSLVTGRPGTAARQLAVSLLQGSMGAMGRMAPAVGRATLSAGPHAVAALETPPAYSDEVGNQVLPEAGNEMLPSAPEPAGAPQEAGAPPETQAAAPAPTGPYGREIDAIAGLVGIPAHLIRIVQHRENPRMDPNITSGDPSGPGGGGAMGLMQLMPDTFEGLRPQIEQLTGRQAIITDPLDSLIAGALYLRQGLDRSQGDVEGALRYYHGGPNERYHGPRTEDYASDLGREFAGGG